MSEDFSEEIDPNDYALETPVTVTPEEKTFVEEFIKGASLEQSADAADMGYAYALKLMERPDVAALVKSAKESMGSVDEIQKREGMGFLADVARTRATDFYSDDGDLNFKDLKDARVPIESIKIRKDPAGNIISQDIKFPSAMDAVKTAAKMSGWEAPTQVEVSGYIGGLSPDILSRIDEIEIDAEIVEDDDEELKRLLG